MKVTGNVVIYALVAMMVLGGALYTVVFVLGGPTDVVVARAAIISAMMVPTVGVLLSLLGQGHLAAEASATKELMNGHLEEHKAPAAQQVNELIDARLANMQASASSLEPKPNGGET